MSWRHLYGRSEPDPRNPQASGVCDRCGILYDLDALRWQNDYRGPQLMNTRLLVCRICRDEPATFTVPLNLPPDPTPIQNARPNLTYDIDE